MSKCFIHGSCNYSYHGELLLQEGGEENISRKAVGYGAGPLLPQGCVLALSLTGGDRMEGVERGTPEF